MNTLRNLWTDDSGISSVEYALLLAFIAAGIIVFADQLSTAVGGKMCDTAAELDSTLVCP